MTDADSSEECYQCGAELPENGRVEKADHFGTFPATYEKVECPECGEVRIL